MIEDDMSNQVATYSGNGRIAQGSTDANTKKQGPVTEGLAEIDKLTEELERKLGVLESRLRSCLVPSPPVAGKGDSEKAPRVRSELSEWTGKERTRLREIIDKVLDLESRVDL